MTLVNLLWLFLVAALLPAKPFRGEPAQTLPLNFRLDQVKELNADSWGPPGSEGGRTFRAVLAGKPAWLRIPGWWGDSIRPPKGAYYILEVTYKDVVDKPVIAEVFGAIEPNLARTEAHRFGGAKDGGWKVANVPCGWDTLIWPKGTSAAEIGFRASSDLPVASIRVRSAKLPEDKARYELETREWVARAQADKAKNAVDAGNPDVPVIPLENRQWSFVPYVRSYFERVYPNSAPREGETSVPIRVRMAQNEYEPGAFAVYAQEDVERLSYSISELRTSDGYRLVCEITRYSVEFALEQKRSPGRDTVGLALAPQRLWPAFETDVRKGQSAWFYFTIHTLGSASKPGTYSGKVTVADGKATRQIALQVEVLPLTLLTMEEAGLRMGGCAKGLPPASDLLVMQEHNHNMVNIWFSSVRPEAKKLGDRLGLEYYYLDDWMRMARERGQRSMVWFLGGNPNGYPETLTIEAELYALMHEGGKDAYYEKMRSPANRGKILPELRSVYVQWLKEVAAHARANNWPELIFTPFDEPAKWAYKEPRPEPNRKYAIGCGPWIRDHFKAACALIHEAVPNNKVYMSLHNNYVGEADGYKGRVGEIFIPDVDIVCTNAIEEDNELGDKVRRAGKEFWQYTGLQSPRFSFGFWFGAWDSRGSLCWAYNWGARFDITSGSNWQYAWNAPFGTVLTPAYEEMREAWDDRRYLETAKAAAKHAGRDISPLLEKLRLAAIENQGSDNGWKSGRDRSQLDDWRRTLADAVIQFGVRNK
jgi:hypothetical protein